MSRGTYGSTNWEHLNQLEREANRAEDACEFGIQSACYSGVEPVNNYQFSGFEIFLFVLSFGALGAWVFLIKPYLVWFEADLRLNPHKYKK